MTDTVVAATDRMSISVIIVSYNCRDMVLACLGSVYGNASDNLLEIIVVDNGSNDGTVVAVAENYPDAILCPLKENVGFGVGCNHGSKFAHGEYILLLNPDTLVLTNTFSQLTVFAEAHPDAGIWGGRTLNPDGSLDPRSCWRFPTVWSTFCLVSGLSRVFSRTDLFNGEAYGRWDRNSVHHVEVVAGALFLIRKDLWDKLEGFDPQYFLYSEEVDLCLRAKHLGARPIMSPEVEIVHVGGGTQAVRSEMLKRQLLGRCTYMAKHWTRTQSSLGKLLLLAWTLSRFALHALKGRLQRRARALDDARAWLDVWRYRGEWLRGYPPVSGSDPL